MMKITISMLLLMLFFGFELFAWGQVGASNAGECPPSSAPLDSPVVPEVLKKLQEIKCPDANELTDKRANDTYNQWVASQPQKEKEIRGKILRGTELELSYLQSALGSVPPESWKQVQQSCETVLCAVGKMLGSEVAAKELILYKKNTGYVVSLSQEENNIGDHQYTEQLWSPAEARTFFALSEKMPKVLQNLSGVDGIYRIKDGYRKSDDEANTAAFARPETRMGKSILQKGEIVAYDSTFIKDTFQDSQHPWAEGALLHETCHHKDFQWIYAHSSGTMGSEDRATGWISISGWKKEVKDGKAAWKASASATFASSYGSTLPGEDFAESCAAYVLNPENLQKRAPEKYEFMKKNVFAGQEYLKAEWNTLPVSKPWPALQVLIQSTSDCKTMISECLTDVKYAGPDQLQWKDNVQRSAGWRSWSERSGSFGTYFSESPCFKKKRSEAIEKIIPQLEKEADYCELGARSRVQSEVQSICSEDWKRLNANLKDFDQKTQQVAQAVCVSKKDLSADCIFKTYGQEKNLSDAEIANLKRVKGENLVQEQVSAALRLQTKGDLIKACATHIGSALVLGSSNVVYYRESKGSQRLDNIEYDQTFGTNKSSLACVGGILKELKEKGYAGLDKVAAESVSKVLDEAQFKNSWKEFESSLIQVKHEAAKCLRKSCEEKILKKALADWTVKDPSIQVLALPETVNTLLEWMHTQ